MALEWAENGRNNPSRVHLTLEPTAETKRLFGHAFVRGAMVSQGGAKGVILSVLDAASAIVVSVSTPNSAFSAVTTSLPLFVHTVRNATAASSRITSVKPHMFSCGALRCAAADLQALGMEVLSRYAACDPASGPGAVCNTRCRAGHEVETKNSELLCSNVTDETGRAAGFAAWTTVGNDEERIQPCRGDEQGI